MDIVLSTDNDDVVNSIYHGYPITYEKRKAKEQNLNFNNFANMDTKSFNSKIGFITNLASSLIAMLSNYKDDSEEYKEIRKRIDLLRYYQGSAIDATKGDIFIPPPKYWSKRKRYISIDNLTGKELDIAIEENKRIQFNNKICVTKKPYFFGYVYPKQMREYKNYIGIYNQISEQKYGMKFKELEYYDNKTEEQKKFVSQYRRYLPLLNNNCIMNILAKYIEGIEFDNKWKKSPEYFDFHILLSNKYTLDDNKLILKIKKIIKDFNRAQTINIINRDYAYDYIDDELYNNNFYGYLFDFYENELLKLCSDKNKLADYVVYVFYTYFNSSSKSLLWNVFGEEIFENIKSKSVYAYFPVKSQDGKEYLGERFILQRRKVDEL